MREYLVELNLIRYENKKTDPQKAERVEAALRDYILSKADTIRLTQTIMRYGFLFRKQGHDEDPKFQATLKNLAEDFIRKETDSERYHIDQGRGKVFNHYFYRLSPKIKEILNKTTLISMFWPQKDSPLYGFEDPSFYKEGRLTAHAISHENFFYIYLEEDVADNFMKQLDVKFLDTTLT